jgi:hypothetical protein
VLFGGAMPLVRFVLSDVIGTVHAVSDVAIAAIASGAALVSSGLTGFLTLRGAAAERKDRSRGELAPVMAAYGYAIDRLEIEISQLPPSPSRTGATAAAVERLPTLDWSLGQLSRYTLGRPAMRALDGYAAAANRLLLVAPVGVLTAMEPFNALLATFAERDDEWTARWREARHAFALAARDAGASD